MNQPTVTERSASDQIAELLNRIADQGLRVDSVAVNWINAGGIDGDKFYVEFIKLSTTRRPYT